MQDLDPRVPVRQADHVPDIDTDSLADERQLVGEGDVDVAEGVLD